MAVGAKPMHVPAGLPLDEATRPEMLDVGRANIANRNVRNNERGALEKRLGFGAMTSSLLLGGGRTTGYKLFAHGDASVPCVIDGTYLDMYSETADAWMRIGRVSEASHRLRDLPTPSSGATFLDSTYVNGYLVVVAQRSILGQPTAAVVDYESGAVVLQHEDLGSEDGHVIVSSYGTVAIACVCAYSDGEITAYSLDTTDLASGWSLIGTVVATSAGAGSSTSAYPSICSTGSAVALVYGDTTGTARVVVTLLTAAGAGGSTTITTGANTPSDLDIDCGDVLWVASSFEDAINTAYATALNKTTLSEVGSTTATVDFNTCQDLRICAGTSSQTARTFALATNLDGLHIDTADLTISAGAVVSTFGATIYNLSPISRPFCRSGRYYMAVAPSPTSADLTGNTSQGLCVVVDWTANDGTVRPIANIEPGLVPSVARFAKVSDVGDNRWTFGFQLLKSGGRRVEDLFLGNGTVALAAAELDFADRERWDTAAVGALTFIGGGLLSSFDGSRVVENGFLGAPTQPEADVSSGSGLTAATGFRYVAIYEDVDANGNWTVSSISEPSDSTGAFTNKTSTVTVSTLSVTSRIIDGAPGSVRIGFYRTVDGGEPPYYRLGATVVDPAQGLVTFSDTTDDATLATRAKLYAPTLPGTVGEKLDRRAPPGLKHIVSYADMLVGAKGSSLIYSGQPVYGEATWFSPVFEVPVTAGGDIVALASQDGALVVFKRDRIFVVAGEIPSDNGAAGGLGAPRLVASDVGCIDPASVVSTSLGVFFQSDRGIELFTRAQTVEWVGEAVQDTLEAFPIITSAVIDVRNSLVRFTLANRLNDSGEVVPYDSESASGGGKDIIFNLVLRGWVSVDDRADLLGAQHACYLGNVYAFLARDGVVYQERSDSDGFAYRDGSTWVPASYTLPPWKLGLQQDQRVRDMVVLFERATTAGLNIEVAEDFGAFGAVTADKVWTETALDGQIRVMFRPRDNGSAVQLRVSDVEPSGEASDSGRGFVWIGITANIGAKQGPLTGTPRLDPELRR